MLYPIFDIMLNFQNKRIIIMQSEFTQKNQSVNKVFKVIEYMMEVRMPLKLQEISENVKFPASTVLRLLTSLIEMGYVYRDEESSKYCLTMKFCKIGDAVKSSVNIVELVRPYLLEISNATGETSYFAIERDMEVVYLDVVNGTDTYGENLKHIGKVAPLHATGLGKLMLLNYDDKMLVHLEKEKGFEKLTQNTLTTIEDLKKELEIIRNQGYAVDEQECEVGVRCVSVPIFDYTGCVIGGISVSGPTNKITVDRIEEFLSVLKPAGKEISKRFGA